MQTFVRLGVGPGGRYRSAKGYKTVYRAEERVRKRA